MARSCPKLVPLLLGAVLPALATGAPEPFAEQPISVDAASSEVDYRTNTVVFRNVVISQGDTRVQADHAQATGLNFANSRWNLDGHVHIDAERHGRLSSDQATVEFRDNHIARATVTGKPAEFEQQRAGSDQIARGHADQIEYDVSDGTVRLADDAWVTDGQNEISGPVLVYNIREQRVQAAAAPGSDQRVHISIAPRALDTGRLDAQKKPTPAPAAPTPPVPTPPAPKPLGPGPGPGPGPGASP
ncbi:MAG TPA: lipopolysaccharide transport periplasmic protein LptA [Steroidobacteraceae bacterium]|jgi:lipopolysaccharide transport protein LptA|nr:lipopolysaccharide transport periplasmic protein LptA [Steroidobacteraceae bacterium]